MPQKMKSFWATRDDDMYLVICELEAKLGTWMEANPNASIVAMTSSQSTAPETETQKADHTASVIVVYTEQPAHDYSLVVNSSIDDAEELLKKLRASVAR